MSELDLYLDGSSSPAERAAFESRATREPAIAREIALQRDIDAGLRRLFAHASGSAAGAILVSERAARRSAFDRPAWNAGSVMPALVAVAALVVALVALGGWLFGSRSFTRAPGVSPDPFAALNCAESGFDATAHWTRMYADALTATNASPPIGACTSVVVPPASTEACRIEALASPAEIETLELTPGSPAARSVSVTVGAALALYAFDTLEPPSVVWIERCERDPHPPGRLDAPTDPASPMRAELRTFRRVVGPFVLYEITRGDRPAALRWFRSRWIDPRATTGSTPR